jgi:hypothetical protein
MTELVTEIEINSSAESVWASLMEFESYPKWNPFIREIKGAVEVGSVLAVHIKPEGGMGAKLSPKVIKADANKMFAWKGKFGVSGIFDGQHEFIIEPIDTARVRFIQREEFSGLLVPILWPMLEKNTRRGFVDMNRALKALVEGK